MKFAALAGVVMALGMSVLGPAGAKVVYRTVDASGFDVGGFRLGMSSGDVAGVLKDRYAAQIDELSCQGCSSLGADDVAAIACDEAKGPEDHDGEREVAFIRDRVRVNVRFYHPDGGANGACAVYDVAYTDTYVVPERDFPAFHDRLVARFGEATLVSPNSGVGMDGYFWCAKIMPGHPFCADDVATVSAVIESSNDFQDLSDRYMATVELRDDGLPDRARDAAVARANKPAPKLGF